MTQQNQPQDASTSTQLQEPQTKPLEGKVEAEKFGYASELLAYRVMDNLASIIAQRVDTRLGEGNSVLLVSGLEYALAGLPLLEINEQIKLIKDTFTKREEEHRRLLAQESETPEATRRRTRGLEPITALTTAFSLLGQAPKIVGTVADVATFFRSNYRITGLDFKVADQALFSSVAGALAGRRITPVIPGFYAPKDSELLIELAKLSDRAAHLKIDRDALASLLPAPDKKDETNSPSESKELLARIATAVRETDAVLQSYQGFRTSWTTPAEGQEGAKLEKALVREGIEKLNIEYLLWLSVFSSGGEATVRDRLIREDTAGFMGGVAVGFVLARAEGEVLAADTLSQFGVNGLGFKDLVGRDEEVRYFPPYAHGS